MSTETNHVQRIKVNIPTALRSFTANEKSVELTGTTVADVLNRLTERFPSLRQHLYDGEGKLRSFVSIYVGDEDIRHLDREHTAVGHEDELSIVPSIAGGSGSGGSTLPPLLSPKLRCHEPQDDESDDQTRHV